MKYREVRRLLKDNGWTVAVQKGSHQNWKHETIPGRVTVAGQDNDDVPTGTLKSIFRQAGIGK